MARVRTDRCDCCGIVEAFDLLEPLADAESGRTMLRCIACYGPDWMPEVPSDIGRSVAPALRPLYEAYRYRMAVLAQPDRAALQGFTPGLHLALPSLWQAMRRCVGAA